MTVADVSETLTVATGIAVTVIVAIPILFSLSAVIFAVPGATAVTSPVADTVAIKGASVLHEIARPVSNCPLASLVSAESWNVDASTRLPEGGATVTEATGAGVTVTAAVPVFPSLTARIFAVPVLTAVTSPVEDTVATPVLSELQVIARPEGTPPFASRSEAVACVVSTALMELLASETVTDATGTSVTVIVAVPLWPSLVAEIVAEPGATAVIKPVAELMVATPELSDAQTAARPVRIAPFESLSTAAA
jgi:hypothetical protein